MKDSDLFVMSGRNGKEFTSYLDTLYDVDYYKIKTHRHSNPQSLHDMSMYYINKWSSLKDLSITLKQKTICNSMLHFVANNYNKKLKYFEIKVLTRFTIFDKMYTEIKERETKKMRYVTNYEMKDTEVLRDLLNEGYVAITENGVAVKVSDSTDDKLIENLINVLES